jgi:hypothetical protein
MISVKEARETVAGSHGRSYCARCCITALKVSVCNIAPRTSEFARFRRRYWPDPVRRSRLDRAVLPTYRFARGAVEIRSLCSAQQSLQHQRISGSLALSAHLGSGTNRDHRTVAPQRSFSLPGRFARISRCHEFATLLAAIGGHGTKFLAETARPLAANHARRAGPSHLRFGQYGVDRLWPSGTGRGGLQPKKRGRPSYLPLLCFEGNTRDCWEGSYHPGNTHVSTITIPLLERAFAKLPEGVRERRVRADGPSSITKSSNLSSKNAPSTPSSLGSRVR